MTQNVNICLCSVWKETARKGLTFIRIPRTSEVLNRSLDCIVYQYASLVTRPQWALARYVKLRVVHAPRMSGIFSPPPRVSDPDMHHGKCMTHVPWCMPGSLTSGFLWSLWRGKCSQHSRRKWNPKFYVSGKRPMLRTSPVLYPPCYGETLGPHVLAAVLDASNEIR